MACELEAKFILAVYLATLHPRKSLVVFQASQRLSKACCSSPAPSMQTTLSGAQALGDCSVLLVVMPSHVANTAVQLYWGQQTLAKMSLP